MLSIPGQSLEITDTTLGEEAQDQAAKLVEQFQKENPGLESDQYVDFYSSRKTKTLIVLQDCPPSPLTTPMCPTPNL